MKKMPLVCLLLTTGMRRGSPAYIYIYIGFSTPEAKSDGTKPRFQYEEVFVTDHMNTAQNQLDSNSIAEAVRNKSFRSKSLHH